MSDPRLDDMERVLKEQLAEVQRAYQETAAPIVKRLVEIQYLRPPAPVYFSPVEKPKGKAEQQAELDWIADVIQRVAELPDRDSPEDWPEAMLVTGDELRGILEDVAHPPAQPQQLTDEGAGK